MFKQFLLAGASALALIGAPANAAVLFHSNTPGFSTFVAPRTGVYQIDAFGAAGGGAYQRYYCCGFYKVGYGIGVRGSFALTQGQVLGIGVGMAGAFTGMGFSGGGASFVGSGGTPLLVAGGGGGRGGYAYYQPPLGSNASAALGSRAGLGGHGGYTGYGGYGGFAGGAGGGGGWNGDGQPGQTSTVSSYYPYGRNAAGGAGGQGYAALSGGQPGQSSFNSSWTGGGGGGFNGGAGGNNGYAGRGFAGDGGTSFNAGSNPNVLGYHGGNGLVEIDGAVPEPTAWALMLAGFGAVGTALRRKRVLRVA